jgi:hypothetical protein
MISMFGGGLAVGSAELAILVIHGLNTGTWLAKDIVTAATIILAVILAAISGAIAIQFE